MSEVRVIRWTLPDILSKRGWTAYKLAKETGLTVPAAYRLATPGRELQRLDVQTLDTLCRVLRVKPGDLLKYESPNTAR